MFPKKQNDSFSKYRAGKSTSSSSSRKNRSFRDSAALASSIKRVSEITRGSDSTSTLQAASPTANRNLTSPIVTMAVGPDGRMFAAHEDILCLSPIFKNYLKGRSHDGSEKRIALPEEQPEVLSSVLEYLYKGDYYPRLLHNKRTDTWELEDGNPPAGRGASVESIVYHHKADGQPVLKETLMYVAGDRYQLPELKKLALRKQGLQHGVQVQTILSSARYAYENTPDSDSKLRAHYLALIIRSRNTFKKSGTMQNEMMKGGCGLFFDLFVAMCNHMDDLSTVGSATSSPVVRQGQRFSSGPYQFGLQQPSPNPTIGSARSPMSPPYGSPDIRR